MLSAYQWVKSKPRHVRVVIEMKKTCRSCHFLSYKSDAAEQETVSSESWVYVPDVQKPRYAIRSWSDEDREKGKVANAERPIDKGQCFKGVWAANEDTEDDHERVAFMQGFREAADDLVVIENVPLDQTPTAKFDLDRQLNKRRRNCYWSSYTPGQELNSAAELESRNHVSGEHKKTRRIAWLAVAVSMVSAIYGFLTDG